MCRAENLRLLVRHPPRPPRAMGAYDNSHHSYRLQYPRLVILVLVPVDQQIRKEPILVRDLPVSLALQQELEPGDDRRRKRADVHCADDGAEGQVQDQELGRLEVSHPSFFHLESETQ